jgi:hypothetical protein
VELLAKELIVKKELSGSEVDNLLDAWTNQYG